MKRMIQESRPALLLWSAHQAVAVKATPPVKTAKTWKNLRFFILLAVKTTIAVKATPLVKTTKT